MRAEEPDSVPTLLLANFTSSHPSRRLSTHRSNKALESSSVKYPSLIGSCLNDSESTCELDLDESSCSNEKSEARLMEGREEGPMSSNWLDVD